MDFDPLFSKKTREKKGDVQLQKTVVMFIRIRTIGGPNGLLFYKLIGLEYGRLTEKPEDNCFLVWRLKGR